MKKTTKFWLIMAALIVFGYKDRSVIFIDGVLDRQPDTVALAQFTNWLEPQSSDLSTTLPVKRT